MIPFVRELTWKFAQIDDDDDANKDQNANTTNANASNGPNEESTASTPSVRARYFAQVLTAQSIPFARPSSRCFAD